MTRCACVVRGCLNTSYSGKEVKFYRMPVSPLRKFTKWVTLIGRQDLLTRREGSNNYICEVHFPPNAFEVCKTKKLLKKSVLPSLHLPKPPPGQEQEPPGDVEVQLANKAVQCQMSERESASNIRKKKLMNRVNHKAVFNALCDRFLLKDVAELVKDQAELRVKIIRGQKSIEYKFFCLYLYHINPSYYMSLQKTLKLPVVKDLRALYTTSFKDSISKCIQMLKPKIDGMTELGKNCIVLVSVTDLKPHLYYHVLEDKLYGFSKFDNVETPQLAQYGIVLMVRGLYKQWVLPIDYVLLNFQDRENQQDYIAYWLNNIVSRLNSAGLKVRICLSNLSSRLFGLTVKPSTNEVQGPTIEKPYLHIGENRLYYAYDPKFLMENVYLCFLNNEFHFQGLVAKWQDIKLFYDSDSKKAHRLVPELTETHFNFEKGNTDNSRVVMDILSERVAAGIGNYIDFGLMEGSAMGTVQFLTMMSRLYKFMTSKNVKTSCEYQKPFNGSEFQMNLVVEALTFLRDLKVIKDGVDITDDVKFIKQLQITIRAIMLLYEDLTFENISNLCTNNIRMNIADNFLSGIIEKSKTKDITAWRLISAFRKVLFKNLFNTSKLQICQQTMSDAFHHFFTNLPLKDALSLKSFQKASNIRLPLHISDYKDFKLPKNGQAFAICEFLLKACYERHGKCSLPTRKRPEFSYTRYQGFYGEFICPDNPDPLVPDDNFIDFVESLDTNLEESFFSYVENKRLLPLLPKKISTVTLPCDCFPVAFMTTLFFRLRISQQLKMNNRRIKKKSSADNLFHYVNLK